MGFLSAAAGLYSAYKGAKSADKAAAAASQGFNYLLNNEAVQGVQQQAGYSTDAINQILGLGASAGEQGVLGSGLISTDPEIAKLLERGPRLGAKAFENYKEGTGYQFRLDQGMKGISGSAAASGILNSGAAAKSLMQFGQNIASDEYSNFFNQQQSLFQNELSNRMGVDAAKKNDLTNLLTAIQNQQQTGLNAAYNTASSGASAGAAQGQYIMRGAEEISSGLGMAAGGISDWWNNSGKSWWQKATG